MLLSLLIRVYAVAIMLVHERLLVVTWGHKRIQLERLIFLFTSQLSLCTRPLKPP